MPKRLSHEQVESLEANGTIVPAVPSTNEPGAVLRALGSTGLPGTEQIEQITTESYSQSEGTISANFYTQRDSAYQKTAELVALVNETLPSLAEIEELQTIDLDALGKTFTLYENLGLQPDIVVTPANKPITFWGRLYLTAENSRILNPPKNRYDGGLLRNGGLTVDPSVVVYFYDCIQDEAEYRVEVVSATPAPHLMSLTPYGYMDTDNQTPHPECNDLLNKLGHPCVEPRTKGSLPIDLPCLPRIDTYLMHQLCRITSGQEPIDNESASWLHGYLPSGGSPEGTWRQGMGMVGITSAISPGKIFSDVGIRPAQDGRYA